MTRAVLLLGGNVGNVAHTFGQAEEVIAQRVGTIEKCSQRLTSPSWGFESQEFLNEAVVVATPLTPLELLAQVQAIEAMCGRDRAAESARKKESGERYLARTIDIDIIFYGDQIVEREELTIPHPLMAERRFVLEPLVQVIPRLVHPKNGRSVEEMLNDLND